MTFGFQANAQETCPEPFFSEYIEGSSNNKAIEIYNPGNVAIDLASYEVQLFSNGAVAPSSTFTLIGMLASHEVYVIANSSAGAEIEAEEDTVAAVINYNGDDAIILLNIVSGDTVDIFGVVGTDPGSFWTVPDGTTQNHTLVRKFEVIVGETDWAIASEQWDVFDIDMFDSLGDHSAELIASTIEADWSSSVDGLNVSFTDESTGDVVGYLWDFGDGSTSTDANPSHEYAAAGEYTVCLTINSSCDIDSICATVTTCNLPVPTFTYEYTELTADFTSDVDGGADTYSWDFGDGATSTDENPTHTYDAEGTYEVCLTVVNDCGDSTFCMDVSVCELPSPEFSATNSVLLGIFTNEAPEMGATYLWDFGDGATSTDENPNHLYDAAGVYTVCLTMTNDCGSDSVCGTVEVCEAPVADYSYTAAGKTISFTNEILAADVTYSWTFGDGATSTDDNPVHEYAADGTYEVCLFAENDCWLDSLCETITINTAGIEEQNNANIQLYPNPVNDVLNLNLGESFKNITFTILAANGKLVYESTGNYGQVFVLDFAAEQGVYFLTIHTDDKLLVKKFVKK